VEKGSIESELNRRVTGFGPVMRHAGHKPSDVPRSVPVRLAGLHSLSKMNLTQAIEAAITQAIQQSVEKAVGDMVAIRTIRTIRDITDVIINSEEQDKQRLRDALGLRVEFVDVRDCVDTILESRLKEAVQPIINDALENIEADDITGLDRAVKDIITGDLTFSISID
jgi:hypothetical protein